MQLKVCMLIARFSPYVGGTELQALRLSQALRKKGIDVFVVTQRLKKLKKFEEIDGLRVYRLFSFGRGKFSSFVFMLSSLLFLIKKNKEYKIIHVHLASSPAIVAIIVGKLFNKKVIVKLGGGKDIGDIDASLKTTIGRLKLYILKRKVDKFIAINKEIKKEMLENNFSSDKIVEISNGVEIDKFTPVDESKKISLRKFLELPNGYIFIFVGRIEKEKNLPAFIDAFQIAIQTYSQIYLVIIGEGSELIDLKKKVKKSKIEQNIIFIGQVKDIVNFLRASDAFVLPSVSEGMPNALLEAMSCELTILASAVGGVQDIVKNNEEGILLEPKNIEQMTQAILKVINNKQWGKQLGLQARKVVVRNYSLDAVAQGYTKLYQQFLEE